jgi:hypothetical protein
VDVGTGEDKFEVNVDGTYYPNGVADGVLPSLLVAKLATQL